MGNENLLSSYKQSKKNPENKMLYCISKRKFLRKVMKATCQLPQKNCLDTFLVNHEINFSLKCY